jgi:hypothetical protein
MTLQETAFMINLIKSNYRRRMFYFFLNLLVLAISFYLVQFFFADNYSIENPFTAIFVSLVLLASLGIFLFNSYPWNIKKRQKKALNECTKRDASFDDLRNSPCLHEYFFI